MKTIDRMILALLIFTTTAFYSQNGTLDNTFNGIGSVSTSFGANDSSIHSMALQPDGKIVVAGTVFNHGNYSQFGIIRFNSNGSPDTTFGTSGIAVSNVPGKISLNSVALQSTGKILAEGSVFNSYNDEQFVLTRFNSNGSMDTAFGTGGVVITNSMKINAMLVQSDDKIIVAGYTYDLVNRDFLLIRYNPDGSLDATYGINGIVTTNLGIMDFGYDIAFQPDGKIVLAGSTQNNHGTRFSDFAILRYDNVGNLDTTFGAAGVVIIDIDDLDEAKAVQVQTNGKIVVAGWTFNATSEISSFKLIRLLPDGSLDSGFGISGKADIPIQISEHQQIINIQADGKIVIAGTYPVGKKDDSALVRYLTDGTIDPAFGVNGIVTTSDGIETYSKANAILHQPDGKILAGGESGEASLSYHPQSILRRYN